MGILKQFEKGSKLKGTVNKAIKHLNEKIKEFLEIYDEDGNEEIGIDELTDKRDKLIKDLDRMQGMIDAIKDLEKNIVEYRKFSYYEESMKKVDNNQVIKVEHQKENLLNEELEARIEIPTSK